LSIAFILTSIIALLLLLQSAFYFNTFQSDLRVRISTVLSAPDRDAAKLASMQAVALTMTKIGLLSCGAMAGLAFGFLGFGLCLVGIKGNIGIGASHHGLRIKLERLTPGMAVMFFACVVISVSLFKTADMHFSYIDNIAPGGHTVVASPKPSPVIDVQEQGITHQILTTYQNDEIPEHWWQKALKWLPAWK
jgi:hypothetical protein